MFLIGFLVSGASNMLSTSITVDLGSQVKGNRDALSTVTGIIDGTGTVGACVGQILLPLITKHLGWKYVFYFFLILVN
jgi:MFS transporter, OPA family, solute carrier family 37 (glycerol-3-phosphate transporter), member 3